MNNGGKFMKVHAYDRTISDIFSLNNVSAPDKWPSFAQVA